MPEDLLILVHKAQPTGDRQIPKLTLIAEEDVPEPARAIDSIDLFESDAESIADALIATLPGGTLDRLVVKLLQHQVSLFVVPHNYIKEALREKE